MFKADYEGKDNPYEDPFAQALRDEMANYVSPVQGSVAPSPDPAQSPAPEPSYGGGYQDVPPSNESYVPPTEQAPQQLGYTNPEPPRPYEGNDVTSGNPPAVGQAPAPPSSYQQTLGWDTGKLNDPNLDVLGDHQKYAFMRAMQASGLDPISATNNPQAVADAVNRMYPGLGVTVGSGGMINWPGLGNVDYSIDSGKGGWFFQPENDRGAGGTATAAPRAAAPTSTFGNKDQGFGVGGDLINSLVSRLLGGGGLFGGSGGSSVVNQNDPFRSQILAALSKLIQEGQQPVGDVSGTPQARAYKLASQRNAETQRSAAAEKRAAQGFYTGQGGASGAFEQDKNAIAQQMSQAQSGYEAQLANTILQDRKSKLENALQLGAGFINNEQQLQLQQELQGVNAALAQTSIQLQLAQALLGNQRFYDELGFRVGQTEAGLNQGAGQDILNP